MLASTVDGGVPAAVEGRAMICKKLEMFPVECIARGYLTGSGLAEYKESGMSAASRCRRASWTVPARRRHLHPLPKAEVGEHDENITYEDVVELVGEDIAGRLRELTLEIYTKAEEIARGRGNHPG